jgi:hypothetical protein
MSEAKKQEVKEAVALLIQLDESSLTVIKSGMELLKARQELETRKTA